MGKPNEVYLSKEYYQATKGNEVPIYATSWINIENIIIERSKSHKTT
jgi:hypothetical protein